MMQEVRCLLGLVFTVACASAQFTLDIYQNTSTNGTYVYNTGVLQYSPGQNCSMCPSATHLYQATPEVISPSGRVGSCGIYDQTSASTSVNSQCEASLAINGELGNYQLTFNPYAHCSVIGVFINTTLT
jgi:hypothetical protein